MSDIITAATADFIDQAVPLAPGQALHALRRERPRIVEATQASQQAMFGDAVAGLSVRHRLAVALHCCRLAQAPGLAALYEQALRVAGLDDREVLDLVHAVALFAWANRLMLNLGEAVWPAAAPA